jgi:hypothetical protein
MHAKTDMQETDQLGGMGFRESALALRAQWKTRARRIHYPAGKEHSSNRIAQSTAL